MMTFEEWFSSTHYTDIDCASDAWEQATNQSSIEIESLKYQLECANDMIKILEKELLQ